MQSYLKYQLRCASNRTSAKKKFPPIVDWALESHQAAIDHAYKLPANKVLNKNYYQSNRPVVDGQLLKAGVRLANILNEVFQ